MPLDSMGYPKTDKDRLARAYLMLVIGGWCQGRAREGTKMCAGSALLSAWDQDDWLVLGNSALATVQGILWDVNPKRPQQWWRRVLSACSHKPRTWVTIPQWNDDPTTTLADVLSAFRRAYRRAGGDEADLDYLVMFTRDLTPDVGRRATDTEPARPSLLVDA